MGRLGVDHKYLQKEEDQSRIRPGQRPELAGDLVSVGCSFSRRRPDHRSGGKHRMAVCSYRPSVRRLPTWSSPPMVSSHQKLTGRRLLELAGWKRSKKQQLNDLFHIYIKEEAMDYWLVVVIPALFATLFSMFWFWSGAFSQVVSRYISKRIGSLLDPWGWRKRLVYVLLMLVGIIMGVQKNDSALSSFVTFACLGGAWGSLYLPDPPQSNVTPANKEMR